MDANWCNQYYKLNKSFKKKYIYHFGSGQGVYSELNSMFFCMLYCLKFKIQFVLYSSDSKFASGRGWDNLFMPFENTTTNIVHHFCNNRSDNYDKTSFLRRLVKFLYKELTRNYMMDDLFTDTRTAWFEKQVLDIPELSLFGGVRDCGKVLIDNFYHFNNRISDKIQQKIQELNLSSSYLSVHIRLGDKVRERSLISINDYIDEISQTNLMDVFVLTDDYDIVLRLQHLMPERHFYSFCDPKQHGYDNQKFLDLNSDERENQLIILLSSIEVMRRSSFFIGTYSSNPSLFLSMCLGKEQVKCLDYDHWLII